MGSSFNFVVFALEQQWSEHWLVGLTRDVAGARTSCCTCTLDAWQWRPARLRKEILEDSHRQSQNEDEECFFNVPRHATENHKVKCDKK